MDLNSTRTVVIADDHAIVRQGTGHIVSNLPNTSVVAEADNGIRAISAVKKFTPNLLILDAAMPMARGIEVLAESRRWSPETRVVLVTGFTSAGILSEWLDAGVDGMVLKSDSSDEMRTAFESVLEGGVYISDEIQLILKKATERESLTHREHEVLTLIVAGSSNSEIGEKLSISTKTVEKHRGSLMRKLGVNSIAKLMVYALREGLLDEHKQL